MSRTRATSASGLLAVLATSPDADESLPVLCRATVEADVGIAAAGIVVFDGVNAMAAVGAWPEDMGALVTRQFRERQGPCYEACSEQETVVEADVAGAGVRRWPSWAPAAAALGLVAVSSRPFCREGRVIGSLFTGAADDAPLDPLVLRDIECAARVAVELAVGRRDLDDARARVAQLQHALDSRVVVEQAKGRLAVELACTVDEAFEWMRRHARSTNRKLHDMAAEVVEGRLPVDLLRSLPKDPQPRSGTLKIELTSRGLRLAGHADPVDAAAVSARLRVAAAASTRVVVDLSELEACDAAVAQALMDEQVRARHRVSVVLDSPRGSVATLLSALGASDLPGLTIRRAATR